MVQFIDLKRAFQQDNYKVRFFGPANHIIFDDSEVVITDIEYWFRDTLNVYLEVQYEL